MIQLFDASTVGAAVIFVWDCLLALVVLALLINCAAWYGNKLYTDLLRIYHLRTLGYWLVRVEELGVREFESHYKECDQLRKSYETMVALLQKDNEEMRAKLESLEHKDVCSVTTQG